LWITPQHAQSVRNLPQVIQGVLRVGRIDASQKVEIEQILPRLPAQGARLDLGKIQIAQRKRAERAEQGARNVARAEHERGLPCRVILRGLGMAARILWTPQQE